MTSAKSLASNFTIQLIGKALSVLVGLGSIALLTRILGTSAFGEYTLATTFLQMFGVVVDFGLTLTMVVMISKAGADEKTLVGNFFGLRLVSGFLLFSLAPLTVLGLPWSTTVKQAVFVGALAYFLMGGATMLVGIFQKHESMWRVAIAELINRFILLLGIAIFSYVSPGVVEMMVASVIANGIWLWSMIRLAKPFVNIRPLFQWNVWKTILSQSWPIAISIIFNLLYLKGDILFLGLFRDNTEVGIYGVAYRIIDVLTVVPTMFMGLVLPSMVAAWTSRRHEQFTARLKQTFNLFMLAVIPIIIGAQLTATELMTLIAGKDFAQSGPILALLTIALMGVFLGALFGHLIVALNKQRVMTWGYVAVAIVSVIGYLILIPTYGMWGAAWMTLISEALIATITFLVVWRTSGVLPSLTVTIKALLAAGVMYLVLAQLQTHVMIDILIGATVYMIGILALKTVPLQDVKKLLRA